MSETQTVLERFLGALAGFAYPIYLQGSLAKDQSYPESFFTFWNNDISDAAHYDNSAVSYAWSFDLNFYSSNPALVNTVLLEAKTALKQAGFIVGGKGNDVPSDEPTHTGRQISVYYLEIGGN